MQNSVDLLLITHNRRGYVEKMLPKLLEDPTPFNLYCWDNHSTDGTADLLRSIDDPRIAHRHFHPENANQCEPCLWFLENAQSDVVGKVDDDVLLPPGWMDTIAPLIQQEPRFGMLGCWIFMESDWFEEIAKTNVIRVQGTDIFRSTMLAGHSFLARREYLKKYCIANSPRYSHGLPVDRLQMSLDGLISGHPLPILFAHNMDDPRSPYNLATKPGTTFQSSSALTARKLGFKDVEDYAKWIEADAYFRQKVSFKRQIQWMLLQEDQTLLGKFKRKWLGAMLPKQRPENILSRSREQLKTMMAQQNLSPT